MADAHRWEWRLHDGTKVAATLDPDERVESVFVGGRLVSDAPRGAKPEGHVLEKPSGVVVRFQQGALICILRVDGEEISPTVWPVRKKKEREKPRLIALPVRAIVIAVVALGVAGGVYWAWGRAGAASSIADLATTTRADNGRFVLHHPARFTMRRAQVPGASAIVLTDVARSEAVVVIAAPPGPNDASDGWAVQKRLLPEALTSLPRNGPAWEETGRSDDKCVGRNGAVVTGKSTTARGEPASVWSCAFTHDGSAYLFVTSLRTDSTSEDARRLRDVVEATELTHLAEAAPKVE